MADETTPTVSPTGSPLIPVSWVPYLVAVSAVLGVVVMVAPPHTILFKVAAASLGVLSALGIASPGLRRQG